MPAQSLCRARPIIPSSVVPAFGFPHPVHARTKSIRGQQFRQWGAARGLCVDDARFIAHDALSELAPASAQMVARKAFVALGELLFIMTFSLSAPRGCPTTGAALQGVGRWMRLETYCTMCRYR